MKMLSEYVNKVIILMNLFTDLYYISITKLKSRGKCMMIRET